MSEEATTVDTHEQIDSIGFAPQLLYIHNIRARLRKRNDSYTAYATLQSLHFMTTMGVRVLEPRSLRPYHHARTVRHTLFVMKTYSQTPFPAPL